MSKDEQDREVGEDLELHDQTVESGKFFTLESIQKEPNTMKTAASQTPIIPENTKKCREKENMIREISFKISENLFKDLKILIVERDRARQAMHILPAKMAKELSEECNYFQTRYRLRIEQNKEKLDRRIDEIWRKLIKMPIESPEIVAFISVAHSEQLTVNARRNLPEMFGPM
uniref:Uncharacterized protein n=1 Tax=Caenorhabditis japonica TaxID=281687 RepID=A0A8R1E8K0_CAEJA